MRNEQNISYQYNNVLHFLLFPNILKCRFPCSLLNDKLLALTISKGFADENLNTFMAKKYYFCFHKTDNEGKINAGC